MARSSIKTWLPLERFGEIIGINPLHFNQLTSATLLQNNTCGSPWFQYSWQHSDRVGRDDLAMAIQQAEMEIAREVGYNLIPDWTVEERLAYPQPAVPGVFNYYGSNPRNMYKSVELPRGHVISGGVKAKTVIEANLVVNRFDTDGDGYAEWAVGQTLLHTTSDLNEFRVYYPGHLGDDAWEIRPAKFTISGAFLVVQVKAWQLVKEDLMEQINADAVDADTATNYETTVDIYRVYNDPATQTQFIWENDGTGCGSCTACTLSTQAGCFHLRDARLGLAVPAPASWNTTTLSFDQGEFNACREPDQVRFWYYSGYRDMNLTTPSLTMSPYWEYAVAYLAASKLDRPTCGCSNVTSFIDRWRRDAAATSAEEGGFTMTPEQASNRIGTSLGALFAWKRIQQNGVKIIK